MPRNPATGQEQRRMITFDAIAPDGTRERLRFATHVEALGTAYLAASNERAISRTIKLELDLLETLI